MFIDIFVFQVFHDKSLLVFTFAPFKAVMILIYTNLGAQAYKVGKYRLENECQSYVEYDRPIRKSFVYAILLIIIGGLAYSGYLAFNRQMYLYYAMKMTQVKDWPTILKLYKKAISLDPNCFVAHMNLAEIYIHSGDYQISTGNHKLSTRDYKMSIKILSKALAKNPHNAFVLEDIGDAYKGMGNLSEANKYYEKARKDWTGIDMDHYFHAIGRKVWLNWIKEIGVVSNDPNTHYLESTETRKSKTLFIVEKENSHENYWVPRESGFDSYNASRENDPELIRDDSGSNKLILLFKLDKSGKMSDLKVKKSSGDVIYDKQVLSALKKSVPFSSTPYLYKEKNINLKLIVLYQGLSNKF